MSPQHEADMVQLMALPSFRRFLFRSIQSAGLLSYQSAAANGSDGRDLAYGEGRRSLGFDLLRDADAALPAPMRDQPHSILTLISVLREEVQSTPTEKPSGRRRDRYDDADDDGGSDDGTR